MVSISAVILARNEERNIRYCLETVRWCDEIVVVDMDSSDKTAEIAREFTDKVFFHELFPAFDIAKKYGVEKASGNWILLIDADEMLQRTVADRLRAIAGEDLVDIVEIPFKHYILGDWVRHTGWGYTHCPVSFEKAKFILMKPSTDICTNFRMRKS
jgi:glycosyltransferase involved in cell wall biosynthesis